MNTEFSLNQYTGFENESGDNPYLNKAEWETLQPFSNTENEGQDDFSNADVELSSESFQHFDPLNGNMEHEQSGFMQGEEAEAKWEEVDSEEEYEWDDEADDSYTGETFTEYFTEDSSGEYETFTDEENGDILENEFLEQTLEKLENSGAVDSSVSAAPPLTGEDLSLPGYTCYVKIDLGKGNYQFDMTGIYVPASFDPSQPVDLIIYLHGMTGVFPGGNSRINDYWKVTKLPNYDLRLREEVNASGKNLILAAPSIGNSPNSYNNNLSNKNGGLDSYVEKVLAAVNTYIVQKRFNAPAINFRNIILAAHSAGGRQMRLITALNNPIYGPKISECWGFDSLYSGMDGWISWAKNNPNKKLFIYFQGSTSVNANYLKNNTKNFSNVFVTRSPARNHYWVPKHHMKERIMNIGQSITGDVTSKESVKKQSSSNKVSSSTKDWSNAIRLNQQYGNSLGWNKYYDQINALLLPLSGNQNVSLGEEAFAIAVSQWQKRQGFSDKNSDGIIGPNTWKVMQPMLGVSSAPKPPSYIPSYPTSGSTAPSIQNISEFNKWHAQKILDNMNAGIIGQNFDSKSQLEKFARGEQVLNVNPQNKIVQILPLIYHISEQSKLNNYREIIIGSFIRPSTDGKCIGHCEGRCIDINHTGGSFETSGSARMVINILKYLTGLSAQFKKSLGFGMPLQGEFFGNKNLAKFKSVPVSNLINAELRQLVPQLGYVFPDNNNHLHIQVSWL